MITVLPLSMSSTTNSCRAARDAGAAGTLPTWPRGPRTARSQLEELGSPHRPHAQPRGCTAPGCSPALSIPLGTGRGIPGDAQRGPWDGFKSTRANFGVMRSKGARPARSDHAHPISALLQVPPISAASLSGCRNSSQQRGSWDRIWDWDTCCLLPAPLGCSQAPGHLGSPQHPAKPSLPAWGQRSAAAKPRATPSTGHPRD